MNDENTRLIEDYIDGTLSQEQNISFEQRLKSDKDFAYNYNSRLRASKLWLDADEYKTTHDSIRRIIKNENRSFFTRNRYYIFSVAASIIVLMGIYLLVNDTNNNGIKQNQYSNTNDKAVTFTSDKPNILTSIDSVNSSAVLISPKNGDAFIKDSAVTFVWSSNSNLDDTLFICSSLGMTIQLKLRIDLSDTAYTIKYPQLNAGKYLWYISDSTNYEEFNVTDR